MRVGDGANGRDKWNHQKWLVPSLTEGNRVPSRERNPWLGILGKPGRLRDYDLPVWSAIGFLRGVRLGLALGEIIFLYRWIALLVAASFSPPPFLWHSPRDNCLTA
jgi:hypothetical protein